MNATEQSYVRYEFPSNGVQSKVYAPIVDVDGDGNIAEDEVYSESWSDGAGRVLRSRTEHPGSTGGWASTFVEYDILGRVKRQSVPTETDSSFTPAGDDSAGPLWTYQKYDWKGRVIRKINTDGVDQTALNDSDILISYEGCGCAGGQVTTIEGELVPRTDTTGNARRKQKVYEDILGRAFKTETFEWDGTTVYSTVTQSFNGRDQVLRTRQYAGSTSSSTYQDTTATFDGHGRLYQSHRPEQRDPSNNLKYTTYNYNPDDSIQSVTDGRGAVTNLEYNSRGLLTEKSWTVPQGSGIADPADVMFAYDNLGNRTQMTDAMGTQTYTYDPLSRMTSETRDFTDTLADEPSSGVYRIEYTYTLGGNLKTLKDPWNQQFSYSHDSLGRLQSVVSSASFDGLTNYAQSPVYNARGQLTGVSYGNGVSMSVTGFNAKLQATGIEIKKGATPYVKKAYEFNSDGSLRFVEDLIDDKFDRFYKYDHQGRTVQGKSGVEARGGTITNAADRIDVPYMRSYSYNTFGQITLQSGWYYNTEDAFADSYTNNRSAENSYDNDGHTVSDPSANYKYDAAGRTYETAVIDWDTATPLAPTADLFDGDSRVSKRIRNLGSTSPAPETTYYVYSSLLGRVISETDGTGRKSKTFVSANGATLAEQSVTYSSGTVERLTFVHQDASDTSVQQTKANGDLVYANARTAEHDPMGRNVADAGPYVTLNGVPPSTEGDLGFGIELFPSAQGYRPGQPKYLRDGVPVSADYFMSVIDSGAIGGLFGLVEMSARMSAIIYSVRTLGENGTVERFYATEDEARYVAASFGERVAFRNIFVDDSWAMSTIVNPPLISKQREAGAIVSQTQESENMRNFREASRLVRDILSGTNKCSSFFGGMGELAIQQIIDEVTSVGDAVFTPLAQDSIGISMNLDTKYSPNVFPARDLDTRFGLIRLNSIQINTNGPFISRRAPRVQGYSAASLKSRVFQLMHEVGHLVFNAAVPALPIVSINGKKMLYKRAKPILPVDGGDAETSRTNNSLIEKACKKEIESAVANSNSRR